MFGWFKRKPRWVDEPDEVHRTRASADQALVRAVGQATAPVVVASFFPASLERVEALLETEGVPFARLSFGGGTPPVETQRAFTLDASRLAQDYGFDGWLLGTGRAFSFLFVEHHPLPRVEQVALGVLDDASRVSPHRVRFYVGLDEPLMAAFGGERVTELMDRLGMAAGEVIQHPMVDRAIRRAQEKLEKRAPNAVPTRSVEEWFQSNLGGRSR